MAVRIPNSKCSWWGAVTVWPTIFKLAWNIDFYCFLWCWQGHPWLEYWPVQQEFVKFALNAYIYFTNILNMEKNTNISKCFEIVRRQQYFLYNNYVCHTKMLLMCVFGKQLLQLYKTYEIYDHQSGRDHDIEYFISAEHVLSSTLVI